MGKLSILELVVVILLIVGGLNWGLVGLFDYNVVTVIFGAGTLINRVVYILVGLAALFKIYALFFKK